MKSKNIFYGLGVVAVAFIGYKMLKNKNAPKMVSSNNSILVDQEDIQKPVCKKWSNVVCIKAPCPQTCLEY